MLPRLLGPIVLGIVLSLPLWALVYGAAWLIARLLGTSL